jgi:hypothetical protein
MSCRRGHAILATIALVSTSLAAACIIADPSTDFPRPAERRPAIIRDRAVPPTSKVLGELPPSYTFLLDVEADPTSVVEWHLFIDYDDLHTAPDPSPPDPGHPPAAGLVGGDRIPSDPTSADAGVRTISLTADRIDTPPDPAKCHVIEALVALGFQSEQGRLAHAFDARGGDSIVWFYSPTGDLRGCPVFDGGQLDGGFPPPPPLDAGPVTPDGSGG